MEELFETRIEFKEETPKQGKSPPPSLFLSNPDSELSTSVNKCLDLLSYIFMVYL